ncbi:MAG TPA: type II toxin-antitoxin system VapC family toxin [Candidatus Cybelea sp.]|jgi:hypothetical protein
MPASRFNFERLARTRDGWLIDTNVISATIGNRSLHRGVAQFFERIPSEHLFLSALTVGEIRKGIEALEESSEKRQALERKLDELRQRFADQVLPVDSGVADDWGRLTAHCQHEGRSIPAIDGLIVATAHAHNLVLVSHDALFQRLNGYVDVYDPLAA